MTALDLSKGKNVMDGLADVWVPDGRGILWEELRFGASHIQTLLLGVSKQRDSFLQHGEQYLVFLLGTNLENLRNIIGLYIHECSTLILM